VSGQPVEFDWDSGEIRISGLTLPRSAVRVLAVDNPKPLTAVAHWFSEKCRYEQACPKIEPAEEPVLPPAMSIVFRDFRFRQTEGGTPQDLAWLDEPTDRDPWKPQGYGFWDEQGQPAQGVGLYRQTFRLPDTWHERRALLACMSFDYHRCIRAVGCLQPPIALGNWRHLVRQHRTRRHRPSRAGRDVLAQAAAGELD
jgi:hypothetical protein